MQKIRHVSSFDIKKCVINSQESRDSASRINAGGNVCHAFGTMLSDGPIRMISQGQELTSDLDEKILSELGMKDHQVSHSFA